MTGYVAGLNPAIKPGHKKTPHVLKGHAGLM
jgi:hypothetical protein